jgi:hypothetical protein
MNVPDPRIGQLVQIPTKPNGPLKHIIPAPDGGFGIIIGFKTIKRMPSGTAGELCSVLCEGKVHQIWSGDLIMLN